MVELIADALAKLEIDDEVLAVGQFNPRGHIGGLFAGGVAGGDAGELLGGTLAGSVGVGAGSLAGQRAVDHASGLPGSMLVAVSAERVYGFDAPTRGSQPRSLVFNLARAQIQAKVRHRVNVRLLDLIDRQSGDRLELEGNRLPLTHSGDVIKALVG